MPELIGGIGTVLVMAAVVGFLSATWEELDQLGKSLVLLGATGGLSAGAGFLEGRRRSSLTTLTSMLWLAGAATLASSVTLAAFTLLPDAARVAIAAGGIAAAAYSAAAVRRSPASSLRQLGVAGGLLYAAGPFGSLASDTYGPDDLDVLLDPLVALFLRGAADDAFALTGALHLLIGAGWLLWAARNSGRSAHLGWIGGTVVVTYAALELHAVPSGVGAFGALLVVLGYLVLGLVQERGAVVAIGATGVLVAGSRVLWSLFSGEVATTVAAFVVGLSLLGWAVRARSLQPEPGRDGPDGEDGDGDEVQTGSSDGVRTATPWGH